MTSRVNDLLRAYTDSDMISASFMVMSRWARREQAVSPRMLYKFNFHSLLSSRTIAKRSLINIYLFATLVCVKWP